MDGFIAAWLVAEGIVTWRAVQRDHRPPVPGQLAGVTLLFAGLAVVAQINPAAGGVATMLGWGLNVAGILNMWPNGLSHQVDQAQAAETTTGGGRKK